MIKLVRHNVDLYAAEGLEAIIKMMKEAGFNAYQDQYNMVVLDGTNNIEVIDPELEVVILQYGSDYIEYDIISVDEYNDNYKVV